MYQELQEADKNNTDIIEDVMLMLEPAQVGHVTSHLNIELSISCPRALLKNKSAK